jgi:hypothetical protein
MGPELLHENVGGNLEEDVGNEEHCEGSVVLHACEMEVCDQVEGFGVGNVDSVEEGEEVEDAEEGYDSEINLRYEFLLGRVRRADDVEVVILDPFPIVYGIRVIVIGGTFTLEAALVVD